MPQPNRKLLILSRYARLGASSRLRLYQFISFLKQAGFEVTIEPLLDDEYITNLYTGKRARISSILKTYLKRIFCIKNSASFDLVWIEKELLPWLPAWLELSFLSKDTPLVVDYDDAIFHQYDQHRSKIVRWLLGNKIDTVMRRANLVVAGNNYLATRALQAGAKRVEILPTVVDTVTYKVISKETSNLVTIGWIGSPATAHYLHLIIPALLEIKKTFNVRLVAIGANASQLKGLPIETITWTEVGEVEAIQHFDIGIMPLPDEPFARGKCGYKLIQYMACGKPVVASPVGANRDIVRDGIDGFWADSNQVWFEKLSQLVADVELRERMGYSARARVVNNYSLQGSVEKLITLFESLVIHTNSANI